MWTCAPGPPGLSFLPFWAIEVVCGRPSLPFCHGLLNCGGIRLMGRVAYPNALCFWEVPCLFLSMAMHLRTVGSIALQTSTSSSELVLGHPSPVPRRHMDSCGPQNPQGKTCCFLHPPFITSWSSPECHWFQAQCRTKLLWGHT